MVNKAVSKEHLILDFETMCQDIFKIPILDCSFVAFDWFRFTTQPYSLLELVDLSQNYKLKVKEQCEVFGCKFTKRDLEWWESQGPEAKKVLNPSSRDVSTEYFVDKFIEYVSDRDIGYWWSRSNTFDPILLQKVASWHDKFTNITENLDPWLVRDTRTFIDAKFDFPKINGFVPIADEKYWGTTFVKHDSRFDIAADVLRLQAIIRAENDLNQVER